MERSESRLLDSQQHVGIDELKHHEKWTVWPRKHLRIGATNKRVQTVKEQKLLVVLVISFSNLPHLSRRGQTSFERRSIEELEELFQVLVKTAFISFALFLRINMSAAMDTSPHLHVSMPHVEKLADFLVLLLPILPLTSLGTIQGGGLVASRSTGPEHYIMRSCGSAYNAGLGHDYYWSGVKG